MNRHIAQPAAAKTAAPEPQTAALTGEALRAAVMGSFRGTFPQVPVAPTYKLGIVLTAMFMVLLPIVYLGIIALVGYGVYWHLAHNHVMFHGVRGRGAILVFAAYLAPAVVGAIMVVFMIKPFFARATDEGRKRSLTPEAEPLLFEFVYHICSLVGAARPRRIDVTCDINASAGFRTGFLSMFSNDMVLTIGLPLAAGMSLKQLAGVIAHEFGHFSQGFGMRLTYVIRHINMWFMRVVYQRDEWDAWLEETSQSVDLRIGWILYLARAGVWLSRKILWLLMFAGNAVTGFMSRQMEFDADRYEARLAGSDTFATTCRQLTLLNFGWRGAQADLGSYFREGRLADNLPKLLMANMKVMPKEVHKAVDDYIADSKTGMFDSHPADKDRIASAAAEQAPGVFFSNLPATVLFSNFDGTARGVTEDYYREIFGPQFHPNRMHDTVALLARTEGEQSKLEARERFFAGAYTALRALRLPSFYDGANRPPNEWKAELLAARAKMEELAPACRVAIEQLDEADTKFVHASQARVVYTCGLRMQIDELRKEFGSDSLALQGRQHAQVAIGRLSNQLEPFEVAAGERLRAALFLLERPAVTSRIENGPAMLQEGRSLAWLANQIANLHNSLLELRNTNAEQSALLQHIEGNERHDALINDIIGHTNRIHAQLTDFKNQFSGFDYPFDHAEGKMTVGHFLIPMVPPRDAVGSVYDAAGDLGQKLMELNGKIISRLCTLAEAVEKVLGLQPLPQPEKK